MGRSERKIGSYIVNRGGLEEEIREHVFPTRLRTTSGDDVGIGVAEWRWPDRTIAQCQSDLLWSGPRHRRSTSEIRLTASRSARPSRLQGDRSASLGSGGDGWFAGLAPATLARGAVRRG